MIEIKTDNHIINNDACPYIPYETWKAEEHKRGDEFMRDPTKIGLVVKLKEGENSVEGHELRKRLKGEKVLNANVLDYLLEHPELIPEEWKGKYAFFWGTIYRDSVGGLRVRCIYWTGKRWGWDYFWLGGEWCSLCLAAVSTH